jgi:phage baseplate assembly protein W
MELDDKGLGFPLRLGPDRGIDVVDIEQSVRAMLEQILFTMPGERVNRPAFGVGVPRYVFEPNSPMLANQIRIALDENVYNYLGKRVRVLHLGVEQIEEALHIRVSFQVVGTVSGTQELEVVVPRGGTP